MSKFTSLVLCVVAASLSSVHVTEADVLTLRDAWRSEMDECSKEYPVTKEQVDEAILLGDTSNYDRCYNYCVLEKVGFFTEDGEYDLKNGLTKLRKAVKDDEQYSKLEQIAKECTSEDTPIHEKDRCDSGTRLSLCFLKYKDIVRY